MSNTFETDCKDYTNKDIGEQKGKAKYDPFLIPETLDQKLNEVTSLQELFSFLSIGDITTDTIDQMETILNHFKEAMAIIRRDITEFVADMEEIFDVVDEVLSVLEFMRMMLFVMIDDVNTNWMGEKKVGVERKDLLRIWKILCEIHSINCQLDKDWNRINPNKCYKCEDCNKIT